MAVFQVWIGEWGRLDTARAARFSMSPESPHGLSPSGCRYDILLDPFMIHLADPWGSLNSSPTFSRDTGRNVSKIMSVICFVSQSLPLFFSTLRCNVA